jgi:hypothetical protein
MKQLAELINELESFIPHRDKLDTAVSAGSIGWHIEHCLLTLDIVIEKMKQSIPGEFKPKFYLWKYVVLVTQKIPRGRVRAPKIVQPKNEQSKELLQEHVESVRSRIKILGSLEKNHHFPHPFLGQMNLKQGIKFLKIHTRHHLRIMKEIR